DDDVGRCGEATDEVPPFLVTQVERDGPLVAPDAGLPEPLAVADDAPAAHRIAVAGRLDLDDLGAVVTQQLPRERPGDEAAELEDPHAVERPPGSSSVALGGRVVAHRIHAPP